MKNKNKEQTRSGGKGKEYKHSRFSSSAPDSPSPNFFPSNKGRSISFTGNLRKRIRKEGGRERERERYRRRKEEKKKEEREEEREEEKRKRKKDKDKKKQNETRLVRRHVPTRSTIIKI